MKLTKGPGGGQPQLCNADKHSNSEDQEKAGRGLRGTGLELLTDTGKREGRMFAEYAL